MLRRVILGLAVLGTVVAGIATPAHAADTSVPGSYTVAYTDASVTANGRTITVRLYYPGTSTAQNAPVAAGEFPAIAFGHGFFQAVSQYTGTLKHLASWGFIVAAPTSQSGLSVNHSAFADDLNASLNWLVAQDATSGSRFYNHVVQNKLGVSGHSMGGGASILAAQRNAAITTVGNLAAAETNPSAATAAGTLTIPMMLVAGDKDTIAGISGNQRPIYNAKPAPKQLRTILGGFHCGFMDSSSIFCDSGSISRATQLPLSKRLLTNWFRYYLAGDASSYDLVWGTAAHSDAAVSFEGAA